MPQNAMDFCHQAVAYLKVEVPDSGEPSMELSEANAPAMRAIGHRLMVAYLVDVEHSFKYVQGRHLKEANIGLSELHEIGIRNLAALADSQVEVRAYGNIFAVLMGGHFEASLVLVDDFWSDRCAGLAPNGFVAAFPARDILAFGDSASAEAIRELNEVCQRGNDQLDHPLTNTLYRRVGTAWQPLHG